MWRERRSRRLPHAANERVLAPVRACRCRVAPWLPHTVEAAADVWHLWLRWRSDRCAGPRPARAEAAGVSRLRLLGHRRPADGAIVAGEADRQDRAGRDDPAAQHGRAGTHPLGDPRRRHRRERPPPPGLHRPPGDHPQRDRPEPPRPAPRASGSRPRVSLRDRHRGRGAPAGGGGRPARRRPGAADPGADGDVPPPGGAERHRGAGRHGAAAWPRPRAARR